jgi:hypothetical protein
MSSTTLAVPIHTRHVDRSRHGRIRGRIDRVIDLVLDDDRTAARVAF